MALSRTMSRLTLPAPPPSPIPTGTGSRSAANDTFNQFLQNSIQLPQLSLPESRFLSGPNPSPAVIDYRSLTSPGATDPLARMLRSVHDFGAFRIINHGISGEEVLSVVNEAKCVLEDCSEKDEEVVVQSPIEDDGIREAIVQVRRRKHSEESENLVVQTETETYHHISRKMEKIASKLEGIAEKLSEILSESIGEEWAEKVNNREEKESIFSVYRYNHQNLFEGNVGKKEKEERESDGRVMMSLHIPGEHCQFYVNPHQQGSLCFDAAADTIVVTIGQQLQEWSLGKLKSAKSEMIFVPDLLGSQASFSIELKFSHPNLLHHHHPHSNIISISDQIFIALLLASLYLLYTYISSLFKGI